MSEDAEVTWLADALAEEHLRVIAIYEARLREALAAWENECAWGNE